MVPMKLQQSMHQRRIFTALAIVAALVAAAPALADHYSVGSRTIVRMKATGAAGDNATITISGDDLSAVLGKYFMGIETTPSIDPPTAITQRQDQLNAALRTYIHGVYDAGTRQTFTAIYANPDTPAPVKAQIDSVWQWISQILIYYYNAKTAIGALADAEAISAYAWDFSQFDAHMPGVTLQGVMAAL